MKAAASRAANVGTLGASHAADRDIPKRLVVAVGGNATHPEEIRGTADEQKIIAARTAQALLPLALSSTTSW